MRLVFKPVTGQLMAKQFNAGAQTRAGERRLEMQTGFDSPTMH